MDEDYEEFRSKNQSLNIEEISKNLHVSKNTAKWLKGSGYISQIEDIEWLDYNVIENAKISDNDKRELILYKSYRAKKREEKLNSEFNHPNFLPTINHDDMEYALQLNREMEIQEEIFKRDAELAHQLRHQFEQELLAQNLRLQQESQYLQDQMSQEYQQYLLSQNQYPDEIQEYQDFSDDEYNQYPPDDDEPETYEDLLELQESMGNVGIGLQKQQIEQYTSKFKLQIIPENYPECSICLEKFQQQEFVRNLPCIHLFHLDCIDNWFERSSKCPVCKLDILNSE